MQNAYSPQVLRILDAVGLTDVFHAWWFLGLLLLVSLCIVAASVDRFPNSWRYFSRPYKYPDESFRRASHPQKSLAIADEESGLVAAERALHSLGFKPERVVREDHFGIFAERQPDLRACGVHRPCQPAAHFLWHAGGRSLGLAWHISV